MKRKQWSIWYAEVRFEDNPRITKNRPVIVVGEQLCFTISFKVTSNMNREGYPIRKWKEANLEKPSVAIIYDQPVELKDRDFIKQIGELHPVDIQGIIDSLSHGRYGHV